MEAGDSRSGFPENRFIRFICTTLKRGYYSFLNTRQTILNCKTDRFRRFASHQLWGDGCAWYLICAIHWHHWHHYATLWTLPASISHSHPEFRADNWHYLAYQISCMRAGPWTRAEPGRAGGNRRRRGRRRTWSRRSGWGWAGSPGWAGGSPGRSWSRTPGQWRRCCDAAPPPGTRTLGCGSAMGKCK